MRSKNPHEVLHPAWAGSEHVAWDDGYEAAIEDVVKMLRGEGWKIKGVHTRNSEAVADFIEAATTDSYGCEDCRPTDSTTDKDQNHED